MSLIASSCSGRYQHWFSVSLLLSLLSVESRPWYFTSSSKLNVLCTRYTRFASCHNNLLISERTIGIGHDCFSACDCALRWPALCQAQQNKRQSCKSGVCGWQGKIFLEKKICETVVNFSQLLHIKCPARNIYNQQRAHSQIVCLRRRYRVKIRSFTKRNVFVSFTDFVQYHTLLQKVAERCSEICALICSQWSKPIPCFGSLLCIWYLSFDSTRD